MTTPRNVWIGTGTSLFAAYPCRCEPRKATGICDPAWCPCAGRIDVWNFAPACCAWWATPYVADRARAAEAARRGWS